MKRIIIGIIVFVIMLFIANLYICSIYPIPQAGYGIWAGTPGGSRELILGPENFRAIHRYNNMGFRGKDIPVNSLAKIRVACIGDSFTEGYGAQEDETWPAVLDRKLASIGGEAYNMGRAGSQSDIYADIIRKVAVPLKVTDIVVCMITSDFRYGFELPEYPTVRRKLANPFIDNRNFILKPITEIFPGWMYLLDRARGRYPVEHGTCWPVMSDKVILKGALSGIPEWNHISYVKAKELLNERKKHVNPKVMSAVEHAGFNPYLLKVDLIQGYYTYRDTVADMGISKDDLVECTDIWVKWYANVCEENDIRSWILYFPLPPLVSKGNFGVFDDEFYKDAPDIYGDTSIRDILRDACAKYNVRFIDATDTFINYTDSDNPAFYRWAPHPTPKGYEMVGTVVSEKIMTNYRNTQ